MADPREGKLLSEAVPLFFFSSLPLVLLPAVFLTIPAAATMGRSGPRTTEKWAPH